MFSIHDMLTVIGADPQTMRGQEFVECGELGSIETFGIEQIRKLFPNEKFSDTHSVSYLPMKMCHSLPSINKRRRCFTPQVLANSVASARDNLIDLEHMIVHNQTSKQDFIIGHIKSASFQWEHQAEVANTKTFIPAAPIPMFALGVLFNRHEMVPGIIEEYRTRKNWRTSMECGHNWDHACFFYRGEFIPVKDAPAAMREGVKKNTILPYKDHEVAACLGGQDGKVDFWGIALTQAPADNDVEILGIIGAGREVGSVQGGAGKRFLPLRLQRFALTEKSLECASEAVDKKLTELANITPIGYTDPSEDGHVHEVLADGTILPAQGHYHYLSAYSLVRGTRPHFTARTDTHYDKYPVAGEPGVTRSVVHMHTVDIDLRGSRKATEQETLDTEVSHFLEADQMKISDILERLGKLEAKVSSGNSDKAGDLNKELASELASLTKEVASLNQNEVMKEAVKNEIASQVQAGTLVTKETLESEKNKVETELTAKFEAEKKQAELRQSRIDELTKLGVSLEATPWEDQPELTIKDRVSKIGLDDAGNEIFRSEFRYLKTMVELEKAKNAEKEGENAVGQGAAAASAATKKRVPLLARPDSNPSGEQANTGKLVGRSKLMASRQ